MRVGNCTSSEIVALVNYGKRDMNAEELAQRPVKGVGSKTTTIEDENLFSVGGLTYLNQCNMERRLQRSLTDESRAKPLTWGSLGEKRVFDILGTEYRLCSHETLKHPEIDYWLGSPDAEKFDAGKTIVDVKCPFTLTSFCNLVDDYVVNGEVVHKGGTIEAVMNNHSDGLKYFWQLVSNGIITGSQFAELIVYMPYQHELEDLRELARNSDEGIQSKFAWINYATDDELPFLIEGGFYKNINIIRFEIPRTAKDLLKQRLLLAGKYLKTY